LIDEASVAGVRDVRSHAWLPIVVRDYHWAAAVDDGSIARAGTVRVGPSSTVRPVGIRARPGTFSCIRR
jgi:hypothetical protein